MAQEPEDAHLQSEDEGGPVKPFLDHLEDLRWVIIKVLASLVVGMVVCMVAAPTLVNLLKRPMVEAGLAIDLNPFGPMGGMMVWMKISLYGGITLALPFILYFVGEYILPALHAHEKRYFLGAFAVGGGLFLAGVVLCYVFMLKLALVGMVQFNQWLGFSSDYWRAEEYFSFVVLFMVGMGLSLEVPVVVLTLVKIGVIPHEWLVNGRRYFFIGNLVLCAFITPDFMSTFFMVIPVQVLMEICILISRYWERQKRLAAGELAPTDS